ncbi:AraC family transcriptional regulator [Croceitalea rosinachiae]|uniref:Helix-turn-helix transcriptional regulator n=1 Tax=Croceitalea rosinachiae TaxID=3075596 RepID=A0ABU3ABR9_9FLAO|nr:helix-turn-helix transcriptional regulator [Croceitalea sp. F388]MDT0607350.1 helix-turn-helix transcriptional regulator [Croceitalea sp. F388]
MRVYPFTIPKMPEENIIVQEDKSQTFFDRLHQHEEIQISHIIRGQGKLIVGNNISGYTSGDTFAIGSNVPHLFQSAPSNTSSHMVSLFFLPQAFGNNFFRLPEMQELNSFFEDVKFGLSIKNRPHNLFEHFNNLKTANRFLLFTSLLDILRIISLEETALLSGKPYSKSISNNQGKRLQLIFDYVIKNFDQKIALETIAGVAHLTTNAFCRFFKQRTNKSFFTFLAEVRIAHACQLLLENNDLSMTEVADCSGFNSISNFNKQFKSIKGISPSGYQKSIIQSKNN